MTRRRSTLRALACTASVLIISSCATFSSDAARVGHLIELAVEFARRHLKPEGALVCKAFHGSGFSQLVRLFKDHFRVAKEIKPKASRDKSAETFLVGIGLKKPGRSAG